jgi:hypothetical protein
MRLQQYMRASADKSERAMTAKTITFDTIREIALALPGVEEGKAYDSPALKVRGAMFAVIPTHKSAEPHSLAVRIDFAQRDELIAAEPDTYYLKDHYVNYPVVLVRLTRVHQDALRDLLAMGHRFVSARGRRRMTQSRGSSTPKKR